MADTPSTEVRESLRQSPEKETEKRRILDIVQGDLQRRDQETSFFRGSDLRTYTDVGMAQFIGHRAKPEWKKGYQYNLFDPITRDKVMAILSKSGGMFEAQFFNTNKRLAKVSELITTVLSAFYQDSTRQLKEKDRNKMTMLAALLTPKAILFEGWRNQKRTIREIEERDEAGEISKTKEKKIVHYNGPWSELCPVQDVIPGSLKVRDLQDQPRLTWAPKMQIEEFQRLYPVSRYADAGKVKAGGVLLANDLEEFTVRTDLKENEVEVIKLFEKWDDRASIIANGVLLTPINSPMPFAHKDYPFVWGGFEELSPFFVYDMPLTMKLLDMQDMNNEILNLSLDMVWRALQEVVLVKDGDEINDDALYGGGTIPVDDPKNFQKFEFGSSFAFNSASTMRDAARRSIESSSLDAPLSGQSGTRSTTAREALIAREAAMEITTLFLQNMENMERDKARLRVKNQIDRYKRPVDWKERIGEDLTKEAIPVFREISVRDARLENSKRGTVNISITEQPRSRQELNKVNVENDKELSQTIDITPEFIRELDFDVEIIANSAVRKSKAIQVGEARAFMNDAAAMPDVLNVQYAAKEYVKSLGKKEDEALAKQPEADPMQEMLGAMGGAPAGAPTDKKTPKPAGEFAPDSMEAMVNALGV